MKKIIITGLLAFIVAGIGGFYAGRSIGYLEFFKLSSKYQNDLETYLLHGEFISTHWERAFNAYMNEKPEIGIWALEGVIQEIKFLSKESTDKTIVSREDHNLDLTLNYARLSKLYSKIGDEINRNACLEQALYYAPKTSNYSSRLTSISEILKFTDEFDNRVIKAEKKI